MRPRAGRPVTLTLTTFSSASFEGIESVAALGPDDVALIFTADGARLTGRERHPGAEVLAGGQQAISLVGRAEPGGAEYQVGGAVVLHRHDLDALDPDDDAPEGH